MHPVVPQADNDDHADPAAYWFARMNSGLTPSLEDEIGFRAWIEADPANIESYRLCQEAWRALALDAAAPEVLALRAAALRGGAGAHGMTRRRALFGLSGGAVAAAAAGVWVVTASSPARATISTEAGQRLTAPLPDGSEVTLAPLTRLRLDYGRGRRGVRLDSGQAYFNVAAGDRRPFSVRAGDQTLTVDAGRFQVTLKDDRPDIVVEAGGLKLTEGRAGPETRLQAGQRAVGAGAGLRIEPVDLEAATAWRLGRLVVRDRPLREVVQAFNLYSSDRLALADDRAGEVRISGSFRYDGSREFVLALRDGFGLVVLHRPDGVWRISAPDGSKTA
ncbi:FecR family protein [Brevundimonas sp.]|jgi:transmembrane sensor|uniref:FecR family protein n=1 Tax=Brevundimonas sp. TaxID=1871086 RepID=UPI0037C0821F